MPLLPTRGDEAGEFTMDNSNKINTIGEQQPQPQPQPPRLRLPPSIRFVPTDEELLTVYLSNRVAGRPLPRGFHIPTRDLYAPGSDPWAVQREVAFPYGKGNEFYCFTCRTRLGSGARRTAGSGTWAAKGKDVSVRASRTGHLVGHRLMLKFVPKGVGAGREESANWIMHEYRLPDQGRGGSCKGKAKEFQRLVLCRIYQRSSAGMGASTSSWEESEEASSVTTFCA